MTTFHIKKTVAQWFLFFTLIALSGVGNAIEVGDSLIIDRIETIDGQVLTEENLKGKYLIVQVWATWCPYCHRQNLNLIELANRTKGKPLEIIALSIDRNASVVPSYVLNHGLNFPVAMMTPALNKAIGKRRGVPELYVVDPAGKVIQKDFGEMVDLDVFDLADYVK
jgi:thiol-disulfide isomerase/thioredoxin